MERRVEGLEVEYLLLALDFGEVLFLLACFGPLQAALLKVFEPGCHRGALGRPRRVSAVLWEQGQGRYKTCLHHNTYHKCSLHEPGIRTLHM